LVHVLVTVREEDWRRASSDGLLLTLKEVELQFDEQEARPIFQRLLERYTPPHILSFEDAWDRFGRSGPLLEFAYFVRENETLRERLRGQINRLRDEVRTGKTAVAELDLLRWVSVASAYTARLNLVKLAQILGLTDVRRTVELLEKEYFVRLTSNGQLVEGLHPIRSTILVDLLTDDDFDLWEVAAAGCLQAMDEHDLEIFLLHAFSRRRGQLTHVLDTLSTFEPRTWTGLAGVFRALLWLGVRNYTDQNLALIEEVHAFFASGWWMILLPDVANLNAVSPGLLRPFMEELDFVPLENRQKMTAFRERLTSKSDVFELAQKWMLARATPSSPPTDIDDWTGITELLFFIPHFDMCTICVPELSADQLEEAFRVLPLELAADLAYSLSFSKDPNTTQILSNARPNLVVRFQRETQIPVIEDDSHTVRIHFLVDPAYVAGTEDVQATHDPDAKNIVFQEAMRRVDLLRRIMPDREAYGSQGYGHQELFKLEHDESAKLGIPGQNLPPDKLRKLNGVFHHLGDYTFRPATWEAHAKKVFQMRHENLKALDRVIVTINTHFRKKGANELVTPSVLEVFQSVITATRNLPTFPKDTVDEWGFVAESMADQTSPMVGSSVQPRVRNVLSLARHKPYQEALRELTKSLDNFYHQAPQALQFMPFIGRIKDTAQRKKLNELMTERKIRDEPAHLPSSNFADAIKALPAFQYEFQERFSRFFSTTELHHLERQEQQLFMRAFSLWLQFAAHPERTNVTDADKDAERRYKAALNGIRKRIEKGLQQLSAHGITANIVSETILLEGKPDLWISFDIFDPVDLYNAFEIVYLAIVNVLPQGSLQLEHHAALIAWNNLWIIPCVRGQAFGQVGWRMHMLTLIVNPPLTAEKWFHFVLQQVPELAWKQLNLPTFEHPRLEVVKKFRIAVAQTALLAGHMASLERMPQMNNANEDVLRNYVDEQSNRISRVFQRVLDASSEMLTYISDHMSDLQDRPQLHEVLELLQRVMPELIPKSDTPGIIKFSVADMATWRDQFKEATVSFELIYLKWLGDILDSEFD
jgi:hypothetical protein